VRLLLDEMLAPRIAHALRDRGHDVRAIGERPAWVGLDDDAVLDVARREGRALVTNNLRDFRPRAAEAALPGGAGHPGMVFVPGTYRRTVADVGRIVAALEAVLAAYPTDDGLRNQETWLA